MSVLAEIVHHMDKWEWETSIVLILNRAGEVLLVRQDYGYRFFRSAWRMNRRR